MDVLVEAFVDNNLGDDLMLELLVRRYPAHRFWAIGEVTFNHKKPYRDWENFFVIAWATARECLDAFDAFLGIGGSLWQEDRLTNRQWPREVIIDRFSAAGKPCLMTGNSIGPILSADGAERFARLIARLDDLTVRDRASLLWVQQNCAAAAVRLTADLVFDAALPALNREAGVLGISVHRDPHAAQINAQHTADLTALIHAVEQEAKYQKIRLFGFNSGSENDAALIEQICSNMQPAPGLTLETVKYDGEIEPFLRAFGGCETIVAMRFHAVVLAVLYEIPFLPVIYHPKTSAFLDDIHYSGVALDAQNFSARLEDAVQQITSAAGAIDAAAVEGMRRAAQENFTATDAILTKTASPGQLVLVHLLDQAYQGAVALRENAAMQQSRGWRLLQRLRAVKTRLTGSSPTNKM